MNDVSANNDSQSRQPAQWSDVHRIEGMPDKMGFIPIVIVRRAETEYGEKYCAMLGLLMEDGFRPQRFLRSIHIQQYSALLSQASRYITAQYEKRRNSRRDVEVNGNSLSAPISAFLDRP